MGEAKTHIKKGTILLTDGLRFLNHNASEDCPPHERIDFYTIRPQNINTYREALRKREALRLCSRHR